jgi:hypothetical protein
VLLNVPADNASFAYGLFAVLFSGQTLCLLPDRPGSLAEGFHKLAVAAAILPPSLVETLPRAELVDLKTILLSGDMPALANLPDWLRSRVTCFYSTPETGVSIRGAAWEEGRKPLMDKPFAGIPIYVLDERLRFAPIGVVGRMYIGGGALAHGYDGCAGLTARRFVPNPFSKEGGARLFRTANLARYTADGNLQHMGIAGEWVKHHGFDFELEEIRQLLEQLDDVAQAAVLMLAENGVERLVAYAVTSRTVSPLHLRSLLADQLPEPLIPDEIVLVEELIRTPAGEIDLKAMPHPYRHPLDDVDAPPENALQTVLAEIWKEVLEIPQVGIHHNFFALGGHSLLVNQVISRVRDALQIEISIRDMFNSPTILELEQTIMTGQPEAERIEKTAELLVKLSQMDDREVENMLEHMPSPEQ